MTAKSASAAAKPRSCTNGANFRCRPIAQSIRAPWGFLRAESAKRRDARPLQCRGRSTVLDRHSERSEESHPVASRAGHHVEAFSSWWSGRWSMDEILRRPPRRPPQNDGEFYCAVKIGEALRAKCSCGGVVLRKSGGRAAALQNGLGGV